MCGRVRDFLYLADGIPNLMANQSSSGARPAPGILDRLASSAGGLALFLIAYAAALLLLLDHLPLWTDELLTLRVSVQPDVASFLDAIRITQGGTLLAFLPSAVTIQAFGANPFGGRLVSAISSVAAMPAVFWLGRRLNLRWPLIPVVLLALCPLQFRYAMEARPYALALCLSVWSTVVFWKLLEDGRPHFVRRTAIYALLVLAAAHAMAFALFVPAAHFLWAAWIWAQGSQDDRRLLTAPAITVAASIAVAGFSLVPWYLYFAEDWALAANVQGNQSTLTLASVQILFHEFTGMGYFGTALVVVGVGIAVRRGALAGLRPRLWLLWILAPLVAIPLADLAFHYFLAIRQVLMLLAPVLLVFAAGAERAGRAGWVLVTAFLVGSFYENFDYLTEPRQDFAAAAERVSQELGAGGCILWVPDGAWAFFGFSHPELLDQTCPDQGAGARRLIVAVSPYPEESTYLAVSAELEQAGRGKVSSADFQGPRVEIWE